MRYSLFVDGFNMYHALNDPAYRKDGTTVYPFRKYKWINYRKLLETKIKKDDSIDAAYYFSAFAYWWHCFRKTRKLEIAYKIKFLITQLRIMFLK
jgi:hypothetical protein